MANKQFNSVDGYSVGPNASISVVDANGNVTANALSANANVSFTGPSVDLGDVANLHIEGGATGQYLQTDGSGTLTWQSISGGTSISNGTSNINIPDASSDIQFSVAGTANVVTVTGSGILRGVYGISGFVYQANTAPSNPQPGDQWYNTYNGILFEYLDDGTSSQWVDIGSLPYPNVTISNANAVQTNLASSGTVFTPFISATANGNYALISNAAYSANLANGSFTAAQLISNVSTGTAPLVVTSNTVVTNLNADLLDGYNSAVANTANTVAVRNSDGNLEANFFIGNGSQLTGIITSVSNVTNGTSNLNIATSGGNVTISVAGNANILTVTGTGLVVGGAITPNANITYDLGNNTNRFRDIYLANSTIYLGSQTISANATSVSISGNLAANVVGNISGALANGNSNVAIPAANGNVNITAVGNTTMVVTGTGANITGTANVTGNLTAGNISANIANLTTANITGNLTAGNITTGSGSGGNISGANVITANTFTGNLANGNSSVAIPSANGNINLNAGGNATPELIVTTTGVNVAGTLNATGNANVGNLGTAGLITATGNVSGGNLTTGGALSVTGNANVGNIGTTTAIITTGNITTVNSGLVQNGNSNVTITANANVSIFVTGNATARAVFTSTGANIAGTANITGNANVGNIGAATGVFSTEVVTGTVRSGTSNITIASGGNITAFIDTAQVFEVTSGGISVTGNTTSGNFIGRLANGNSNIGITANGNVTISAVGGTRIVATSTGANITGTLDVSGNTTVGNLIGPMANGNSNVNIPAANGNVNISAVGNANILVVTGTGVNVTGTLNATGNANVGNIGATNANITAMTATGNISANNLTTTNKITAGNGFQVTTGGASITGNIDVTGNFNVTGNLNYSNVTDLVVGDPLIYIGANNTGDIVDLGVVASYNTGTYYHTGLARNYTNDIWTFFDGVVNEPTTVIDWANATYPTVKMGNLNTTGNANITGIANVTGNIIAGNVYANSGTIGAQTLRGEGGNLSNIQGGNVSGVVSSATSATTAGTVTTNAQSNITSVGTLTSLAVSGTTGITSTDSSAAGSTTKIVRAINGTQDIGLIPRAASGAYNNLTVADDAMIVFANSGAQGNANLTIAPWASATSGIRIQSAANVATIFLNATNTNVSATLNVAGGATLATSSGNVGVGASSPKTRLQVSGITTLNAPVLGNAANAPLYVTNNDSAYGLVVGTNASDGHVWLQAQRTDVTATAYNITLNEAGGNVGIGNSAPTDTLSVTGTIRASANIVGANIVATNNMVFSVATGISAAGTVQGNATSITKDFNVVSTVASGAGVVLPTAVAGYRITVINTSANALLVYPAVNGIINSQAANAAYSQPAGARLDYISTSTTQWYTLNATYG